MARALAEFDARDSGLAAASRREMVRVESIHVAGGPGSAADAAGLARRGCSNAPLARRLRSLARQMAERAQLFYHRDRAEFVPALDDPLHRRRRPYPRSARRQ